MAIGGLDERRDRGDRRARARAAGGGAAQRRRRARGAGAPAVPARRRSASIPRGTQRHLSPIRSRRRRRRARRSSRTSARRSRRATRWSRRCARRCSRTTTRCRATPSRRPGSAASRTSSEEPARRREDAGLRDPAARSPYTGDDGLMLTERAPYGVIARDHADDEPDRDDHQQRHRHGRRRQRGRVQRRTRRRRSVQLVRAPPQRGDLRPRAVRATCSSRVEQADDRERARR